MDSFRCMCDQGYTLTVDGKACKGIFYFAFKIHDHRSMLILFKLS